ncbi:MAG: Do family serine endopeptidase [Steroidobacteraceae bacterium]
MQLRKTTLALTAGGLLACGAVAGWLAPALTSASAATAAAPGDNAGASIPLTYAPNYTAIVAQNRAAVVSITTEAIEHPNSNGAPSGNSPFGNDPFFQFFGVPRNVPVHALGSGFIVRSDGVILTNAHVVSGATHVTVKLANNREYHAKVVGMDKPTDIAVLKIDAKNLPTVRIGNSNSLQVGNYVLALGAPYGFEESATAGIVSAIGRELPGDSSYVPFIQTDVAVNPGNSGGPLFDEHGEVVGINSQIYSNTGGFEGVSFSIPINVAMHIEGEILTHGKVEHARLGVEVQNVNQQLAQSFGLSTSGGALVAQVEPDSAAANAGIKAGDVILKYDGKPVGGPSSLAAAVGMSEPGSQAKLDIWRHGKAITKTIKLGNAAKSGEVAAQNAGTGHGRLGLAVRPLTPGERQQAGVAAGLLVEHSTGAAAEAGIQPGDIVLSADGMPLDSVQQLRRVVRAHKGNTIALLVQHGDQRIFFPVQLG